VLLSGAIPRAASAADNGIGSSCQNPYTAKYTAGQGWSGDVGQFNFTGTTSQSLFVEPAVVPGLLVICEGHGTDSDAATWSEANQNGIIHTPAGAATLATATITARDYAGTTPGSSCAESWTIYFNPNHPNLFGEPPEAFNQIVLNKTSTHVDWAPAAGNIMCGAGGVDTDQAGWGSSNIAGGSHDAAPGYQLHDFVIAAMQAPLPRTDLTAPASPANAKAVSGDSQLVLSWSANSEPDFQHYDVYPKTGASCPVPTGSESRIRLTQTSYVAGGLDNGTPYAFCITAVDVEGNESAPAVVSGVPQAGGPIGGSESEGPPSAKTCDVPRLRGRTLARAKRILEANDCALGKVKRPRHPPPHVAQVVARQSVRPGSMQAAGFEVNLRLAPRRSRASAIGAR
jgi:hypothetical protein